MPIVNPIWFYIMSISTGLKVVCISVALISGAITGIVFMNIEDGFCEPKDLKKPLTLLVLFGVLSILVPSENTIHKCLVANLVTYENVEVVKGEATELIDYIIDSVDKLNDSKECE